jgi:hypothetical protein
MRGKFEMKNIFTEHPRSTDNPQGYWAHGFFSFTNSVVLLWFCLLGIVHAVFPFIFKFDTSSAIIRSFKKLVKSNRHKSELVKYGIPDINWEYWDNE